MLQSVGGDDDGVLALCSVCCVFQSVGDDDDGVLALCSVCCVFQSVGDDDDGVLAREERRRDHISHYILRLAYCRK